MAANENKVIKSNYDASSIQILEGLEPVRKRPGMYIGATDENGVHHLAAEIIDNSLDELMNGYGDTLKIIICKDNSLIIEDNGRGIPIDNHAEKKVSAAQIIFTELHAGGKFNNDSYAFSGGLHGVGASVVNALSEFLNVYISRNKKMYELNFINGGEIKKPLFENGISKQNGTKIHFKPDKKYFSVPIEWNLKWFQDIMSEKSFLIAGSHFDLVDERNGFKKEYYSTNGIVDFVEEKTKDTEKLTPICVLSSEKTSKDLRVQVAFTYTTQEDDFTYSFANSIRTFDGGTHEAGFKSGYTKAIFDYLKLLGKYKNDMTYEDIKKGLTVVINLKVSEKLIQFESQTKRKLSSPDAKSFVDNFIKKQLPLTLKEQKETSNKIVQVILDTYNKRKELENLKTINKMQKSISNTFFVGKLALARSKNPEEKELFIVEGDSAGGSAKQGRDNFTQAILPLKGKPLNALKAKISDILTNEEIKTIIHALGTGISTNFVEKDLNYKKIIIMTDADDDGSHIQTLLLTFFFEYMRPLLEKGLVYLANPPLYKAAWGKEHKYFYTNDELDAFKKTTKSKLEIQRYKGLGEMNASQLWDTTMNPKTRHITKIELAHTKEENHQIINTLMGDDSLIRKQWIESNIVFTEEYE